MTPEEKDRLKRIRMILKRGTAEPMPGDTIAIEHKCENMKGGVLTEENCALPNNLKQAKVTRTTYQHAIAEVPTLGISFNGWTGKWIVQRRCVSHIIKYAPDRKKRKADEA